MHRGGCKLLLKVGKHVLAVGALLGAGPVAAEDMSVKIGVLNDQSGIYSDLAGRGSVIAARMAVEDFAGASKGINVEIVSGDHQNKPDVGNTIARDWIDQQGVDVIADVPTQKALSLPVGTRVSAALPAEGVRLLELKDEPLPEIAEEPAPA